MIGKVTVIRGDVPTDLFEYIKDSYLISVQANDALEQLRAGLPTWVPEEQYRAMNISLWMYYDDNCPNAFCCYNGGENYIALSSALLVKLWNVANEFTGSEDLSLIFRVSEENKQKLTETLYRHMLNFVIAHEYGHVAHGHLRENGHENTIDEVLKVSTETMDEARRKNNWLSQLKEYDADSFAVAINSALLIQEWSDDLRANRAKADLLFLSNYLCFRVFAENTGKNFDEYFLKDMDEYNHPYPGIRMYYSFIQYGYWIGVTHGFDSEETLAILESGSHAVIGYERTVLKKGEIKDSYFSVAFTEKGIQHVMRLNNEWNELIDYFNQFAYCIIKKLGDINNIPFSLDENGNFIRID